LSVYRIMRPKVGAQINSVQRRKTFLRRAGYPSLSFW
jgi:hypothetical protein